MPFRRRDLTLLPQLPLALLVVLGATLAPASANLKAPPNSRLPPEAWMTTVSVGLSADRGGRAAQGGAGRHSAVRL